MKMLEKFQRYPWVTAIIFVALGLVILYGLVDLFGSEWVAERIEQVMGEVGIGGAEK